MNIGHPQSDSYSALRAALMAEVRPETQLEILLAESLALSVWRSKTTPKKTAKMRNEPRDPLFPNPTNEPEPRSSNI